MISLNGRPLDEAKIRAGLEVLRHRGPDHQDYWLSPDRTVALGHTRLSIIDLETGDQPIADASGERQLVANGELYDFERIRRELEGAGAVFKTRSDSEIALHLYMKYGPRCMDQLRGEFAFNIWDAAAGTLFAARDRFGIKPLYYTVHDGTLYLASEIKALFAAGAPAEWDMESFVTRAFIMDNRRTLFKRVFAVPPGHYMVARQDTDRPFQLFPYWDFDYQNNVKPARSYQDQEIIEDIRQSLLESIRLRLRADVPVGVYLSGGLDSCAILGMAAQYQPQIEAFSIAFTGTQYDEAQVAARMASHAGARFNTIPVSPEELADAFADSIWNGENVSVNVHTVAKYVLSLKTRNKGFKVVLTGEGSDEIFGGYPHFFHDMNARQRRAKTRWLPALNGASTLAAPLFRTFRRLQRLYRGFYSLYNVAGDEASSKKILKRLGYEPSWFLIQRKYLAGLSGIYADGLGEQFRRQDVFEHLLDNNLDLVNKVDGRHPLHASMYLWAKSIMPTYQLSMLGDRMEMANSIEGRTPFLDHHLVEKVVRLPPRFKIRKKIEKFLLREAVRDYIIPEVYRREKRPFVGPPAASAPGSKLFQMIRDTLTPANLAELPFFDAQKVLAIMAKVPDMPPNQQAACDANLLEALSLHVLKERFRVAA